MIFILSLFYGYSFFAIIKNIFSTIRNTVGIIINFHRQHYIDLKIISHL